MVQRIDTKKPLVSVITPFYNGADWLREAVNSVISQSYTNWELILIDDGSGEEATNTAKAFSKQYPGKIIYTEHPGHKNKGVTASRNLGIKTSNGELVAFLDSDDCWLPGKLENQIQLFAQYPEAGMICEASEYWSDWENPSNTNVVIQVGAGQSRMYEPPQLMYILYPLGKGAAPCPSGIIMTRQALLRSGGFEESFVGPNQVYEDQAFLCKIYLNEKVYVSGAVNNLYRQRSGSLMQSIKQKRQYFKVRAYFLDWLENYLAGNTINDKKINHLVRSARFEVNNPRAHKLLRKLRLIH